MSEGNGREEGVRGAAVKKMESTAMGNRGPMGRGRAGRQDPNRCGQENVLRDQRCLQPGARQGERRALGCQAFPRPLHHHSIPADTVSVFQVSE